MWLKSLLLPLLTRWQVPVNNCDNVVENLLIRFKYNSCNHLSHPSIHPSIYPPSTTICFSVSQPESIVGGFKLRDYWLAGNNKYTLWFWMCQIAVCGKISGLQIIILSWRIPIDHHYLWHFFLLRRAQISFLHGLFISIGCSWLGNCHPESQLSGFSIFSFYLFRLWVESSRDRITHRI